MKNGIEYHTLNPMNYGGVQLGEGSEKVIMRTIDSYNLEDIDYIKIDIEGWEWGINPRDLEGIRRIAFEPHIRLGHRMRDKQALREWIKWLESEGYKYALNWSRGYPSGPFWVLGTLHARREV